MTKENSTRAIKFCGALLIFLIAFALALPFTSRIALAAGTSYTVCVKEGYLALRTAKAYDDRNEIGELYTGDTVEVTDSSDSKYWYVYSPKHGKSGYVNKDYLAISSTWTVRVDKGYLALRTKKAYDSKNEIGELYTGDTVEVCDFSDSKYWYVYSPKLRKSGYVNKDYLYGGTIPTSASSGNTYKVNIEKGYLALRSAKAYDDRNEIGRLHSGDVVEVSDYSDATYWYVYAPGLNKSGYVNKKYLTQVTVTRTVRVNKGYLALRNAKAYDSRNEIGELYTGDTVQILDSSDSTYWYVYSPKLNKNGYVNKDYLN